jgi:hypothetical protein
MHTHAYIYIYIYIYTHTHTHTHIHTYNHITNAPTYFGASASSAGSFDIAFAKVIKF